MIRIKNRLRLRNILKYVKNGEWRMENGEWREDNYEYTDN